MLIPSPGPSPLPRSWWPGRRPSRNARRREYCVTCRCSRPGPTPSWSSCSTARRRAAPVRRPARDLACADLVPGARTVLLDGLADLDAARATSRGGCRRRVRGPRRGGAGRAADDVRRGRPRRRRAALGDDACRGRRHPLRGRAHGRVRRVRAGLRLLHRPAAGALGAPAGPAAREGASRGGGAGGEYTGVYPTASPGGWRLVGRTDARAVGRRPRRARLLTPGTRVRFVEV